MTITGIKDLRRAMAQERGNTPCVLGLDHSPQRIGVAFCELTTRLVTPLTVLRGKKFTENIRTLADLCAEYRASTFVIGLPLNMDGSEGARAQSVRHFALNLERAAPTLGFTPLIAFCDERLSSFAADARLSAQPSRRSQAKAQTMQDALAACIILEDALTQMDHS